MTLPVYPYRRPPEPPIMCLLGPEGVTVSEKGQQIDLERLPENHRVFCSYDTVRELLLAGHGEALCWNGEEIRWRHRQLDAEGWKSRPSDVNVIRLPFPEDHRATLRALCAWRDWLASHRAAPLSTTGSAAWSLLRASLLDPLWLSIGDVPPLRQTLGGRQELGPAGQGLFEGTLRQLDLPAAYAAELGGLRYGGRWVNVDDLPLAAKHEPAWWAQHGRAVFVRADLTVPELPYGPLPRRTRKVTRGLSSVLLGAYYPVGTRLRGVWTWQEVEAAVEHGARLHRVSECWAHLAGDTEPFARWWTLIQEGRQMPGLAGLLAKTTGNALWGRLCMDPLAGGVRTIASRNARSGKLLRRPVKRQGGLKPDHALAETVSGRTRARLYRLMMRAGDQLVSAHTDGAWVSGDTFEEAGWREKARASRLELLDPQVLRYWQSGWERPFTVFSGVPAKLANAAFQAEWDKFEGRA